MIKLSFIIDLEIDDNGSVSITVDGLESNHMGGVQIPPYTGELNRSIQSPNWLSCSTDPAMESWYVNYTEKEI